MDLHPLTIASLCSGIAGLDIGLQAGLEYLRQPSRVVLYCEREASAQATLLERMAETSLERAPICDAIEDLDERWAGRVDCIVAGFSCQPWANVGDMQGTEDERWLWPAIEAAVRRVRPSLVFLENVPGLVSGCGINYILDDLTKLGFDAEWGCLSAAEVGASQHRKREFILAYTKGIRFDSWCLPSGSGPQATWTAADSTRLECFAPGPDNKLWNNFEIVGAPADYLQPSQSGFCQLVTGDSFLVDGDWADQIRHLGNACIPAQAATAFVLLAKRAGLISVQK